MRRLAAVVALLWALAPQPASAGSGDTSPAAQQLAERYAPVLMLRQQSQACDADGEPFDPIPVDAVLGNREVALRQLSADGALMQWAPTAEDLFGLGGGTYLDFPGRALDPGCLYERDGRRFSEGMRPTVYAHIAQQDDHPDQLALQFWFYWYYNDWNNKHESDWEGIQLLFDAADVEAALATEPVSVGYAQHEGGEAHDWDDGGFERDGDRPVVYTSARSHASYFGDATYLGRGASEGFGCDDTNGPHRRVDPEVVLLPDTVDDPTSPLAWLAFEGRWGERQSGPFNAPTGLASKHRWTHPVDWHDHLRHSSVTVPEAGSVASEVVDAFCSVVEWGSNQVVTLKQSPTRVLASAAAVLIAGWLLVRRTRWDGASPHPVVARRRAGQVVRAALVRYRSSPATFVALGLGTIPIVVVCAAVVGLAKVLPLVGPFVDLTDGEESSRLGLSVLGGGLATAISLSLTAAATSWLLVRQDEGQRPTARSAWRAVWANRRAVARSLALAVGVPALAFTTVIGSPIGFWLAVRWQFAHSATMLETDGGRPALARSSELARGRWLHTMAVTAAINAVVLSTGFVIALVALVAASGLPMWALSVIAGAVNIAMVPLGAIAVVLLYGDAVAEHADRAAGADREPGPDPETAPTPVG